MGVKGNFEQIGHPKEKLGFFIIFQIFLDLSAECANISRYGKKTAFDIMSLLWAANADGGHVVPNLWRQG